MSKRLLSLVIPCRNGGASAVSLVKAVAAVPIPQGIELEAVVVDDASTDDTADVLRGALPAWARIATPGKHLGRSGARNFGAAATRGEWLLFLDCDCLPAENGFVGAHVAMVESGADASIGDVRGRQEGFWGRYQSEVGARRARKADSGAGAPALTAANLLVRRSLFDAIGGFDERYRHYGFEDRDFLLRLARAGARLARAPGAAAVTHAAALDLPTICSKMRECGRHTAPLFGADHPIEYRSLGYAALDARLHPLRARMIGPPARLLLRHAACIEGVVLQRSWPYPLQRLAARGMTALAYLDGTRLGAGRG